MVADRVRALAAGCRPPTFEDAPGPDAALFLCAIDHRSGYRGAHTVEGAGPFEGSDLIWHLGCASERARPGTLSAEALRDVDGAAVEALFRAGDETVAGADVRARLWRDLAGGLLADYDGSAESLIAASAGRLGGTQGLITRLARSEAYSDPLQKKSFLFAKIAARRGWLTVTDPDAWQVCADNVLMRLCLRSGLVAPGDDPDRVRSDTREALKRLADESGVAPPLLDDLLWDLGRSDPDLLGTAGGDLAEPPRPPGTFFY